MALFRRKLSEYDKAYQKQFREIYSRARMRDAMMAAKRDALQAARIDTRKMSRAQDGGSLKGVLSGAQAAASQFAANVEEANRRIGIGCGPERAYGKHAFRRRNK